MAGEKDKVVEPAKAAEPAKAPEPTLAFPVERLTGPDAYALTGYESHVVTGALHDVSKENLTIEEAQSAVKAWLAPVKEA